MKKLILTLAMLTIPVFCFAAEALLPGGNRPIQTFAPDGTYSRVLTVDSVTVDMADNLMFAFYSGSGTCFVRLMPTSSKAALVSVAVPNAIWITYAKNPASPFANFSGCVAGYLQRQ